MYDEVFSGAFEKAEEVLKVFLTEQHDEIVLLKDIPVYSFCEHHMLPFFGKAHVAYIQKDTE